jgi:catechol 2,3-dioxygenase-like lactoylglutathione lyase family enzyme
LAVLLCAAPLLAQAPGFGRTTEARNGGGTAAVTGLFNWIHSTSDADRGVAFYRDVLGLTLVHPEFNPPPPTPPVLRPRAQGGADPLVWDLTGTKGSTFRNAFMHLSGVPFGHELSEFTGIPQRTVRAHPWDSGATISIFHVPDLDRVMAALARDGAEIVTAGRRPVTVGGTRAVVARDPDGHLVEVVESPTVGAAIGLTVASLAATRRFYGDLLGFVFETPTRFETEGRALLGMTGGEYRVSAARVPGTAIRLEFYEFRGIASTPARWRFQDPGSPQFQFRVRDLNALLDASIRAKVPFVSAGRKPIDRPFGRFVFVEDPDGVFVEYVEPRR